MIARLDRAWCERAKYDEFLHEALLKKAFAVDELDARGVCARLRAMREA